MSCKSEFKIEDFVEFFGKADEVVERIDNCEYCGAKLLLSHLPDYRNLLIQETSRCLDCGGIHKKVLHILN